MHELSLAVEIGSIAERKLGATVRARLAHHGVTAINFMSSPGAGTTTMLPYVPFDIERAERNCRQVTSTLRFIRRSALCGDGLADWFDLLRQSVAPLARV